MTGNNDAANTGDLPCLFYLQVEQFCMLLVCWTSRKGSWLDALTSFFERDLIMSSLLARLEMVATQ